MKGIVYRLGWGVTPKKLTLLLGSFDGLHLGHYELIKEAKKRAEGDIGVLLFSNNMAPFLGKKSESILTTLDDKLRLFSSYGFSYVFVIPVTPKLLALDKDSFLLKYIAPLSPSLLICGEDYSFGYQAKGRVDDLKERFPTLVVPLKTMYGEKIGTQGIIAHIEKGEIEKANEELGRPYEVNGRVTTGFQNGRKIGFPTANISLEAPYVFPRSGVYKTLIYIRGIPHLSLTNIGNNPTFGLLDEKSIETYIPHFEKDIYGETVYLSFLSFIREEKRFASVEELREQIEKDEKSLDKN